VTSAAEIQGRLKGKVRWLLLPSSFATTPIGAATVFYCYKTFDLPPGSLLPMVVITGIVFGLLFTLADRSYRRRLRTLQDVGTGAAQPTRENLKIIAQEIAALPDAMVRIVVACWTAGVLIVVITLHWWVPAIDLRLMLRMIASALVYAPIGVVLAYIVSILRGRKLLALLPDLGLPTAQLFEALSSDRRQLRVRLLVFSAVMLLSPGGITADVAVTTLTHHLGLIRQAHDPAVVEALADQAVRDTLLSIALMGGMVLAFGLVAAWLGGSAIADPLRDLAHEASRIAAGDLREPRLVPAEDELWTVSSAFARMQSQVTGVLSELQRAGLRISTTTEELLATTSRSQAGANEQASSVHETSATTEELARVARQIAENAESVAKTAEKTLAAAQGGQAHSKTFIGSMGKMRQDNRAVADSVLALNQRVGQIGRIVEFINGIADKADLLALNAELEGTKAGEIGRGFSLVAGEMRRLAENVMRSTREIEQLIDEIRGATKAAVGATEAGVRATESGAALAQQVSEQLERIVTLARETSQAASTISQATQQQQTSSGQLAEAMSRVLAVTDQTASSTRQVADSTTDLASLARELKTVVERFKVS
jgi:methyl-accepting chemotaxis protein